MTPVIFTVKPFHGVLVETNATNVLAPAVLNAAIVCDVCGFPLLYPALFRTPALRPRTAMLTVAMLLSLVPIVGFERE